LQIHFVEEFQPEQEVITNNHTNFFTSKKKTLHGVLFLSGKTTENKNKKHDHHFFSCVRRVAFVCENTQQQNAKTHRKNN